MAPNVAVIAANDRDRAATPPSRATLGETDEDGRRRRHGSRHALARTTGRSTRPPTPRSARPCARRCERWARSCRSSSGIRAAHSPFEATVPHVPAARQLRRPRTYPRESPMGAASCPRPPHTGATALHNRPVKNLTLTGDQECCPRSGRGIAFIADGARQSRLPIAGKKKDYLRRRGSRRA